MNISTDSTANNDDNIGGGYRDERVNNKSKKTEKTARITEIIEVVQIMKNKKENKNTIQINKGNNNVQNSNTIKTMENFEMESEYRTGKETDRKYNYLHPQFKDRNEYNIYSKNEETYNNKNTEQIGKELKEKNVSENSIRKERRGNEENNDKNYNNTITDLITSTEKKQRERESSESIIKKIGIIKRTEREEISS